MKRFAISRRGVPKQFPTHAHRPDFWEALGRCVATFGFLEETLARAIFAFTATRPCDESDIQRAYHEWLPKLERALTDPLGNLIDSFGRAVKDHPMATIDNLDDLLDDLRRVSIYRNVICHGSWRIPDGRGASIPFFMSRKLEIFETAIDRQFLVQLQRHSADLVFSVIDAVTHMGWQFPGSKGPGRVMW